MHGSANGCEGSVVTTSHTAVEMRRTRLYHVGDDTHITAMDSLAGRGNLFEPSEQSVTTTIFNFKFI